MFVPNYGNSFSADIGKLRQSIHNNSRCGEASTIARTYWARMMVFYYAVIDS